MNFDNSSLIKTQGSATDATTTRTSNVNKPFVPASQKNGLNGFISFSAGAYKGHGGDGGDGDPYQSYFGSYAPGNVSDIFASGAGEHDSMAAQVAAATDRLNNLGVNTNTYNPYS